MLDYPPVLKSCDVHNIVETMHHSPEDFHEGDIDERIRAYDSYGLACLMLDAIDLNEWNLDADLVAEYAQKIQEGHHAPPIIYDPLYNSIIDGAHRANAAHLANCRFILAYVGQGQRHEDEYDEDEDIEEDDFDDEEGEEIEIEQDHDDIDEA